MNKTRDHILTGISLLGLLAFLYWAETNASEYQVRLLINCAIFVTLAVSYNLVNGICGQFSLAPNAFLAFLMGFPVFRVRGDYLAIVTLGFGETVRVVANNVQSVTNGPLGLKGLAPYTNLWWSFGIMVLTVSFIWRLSKSSFGRAMKSIREDEVAAEAMGVRAFRYKMMAFIISGFFGGIAGGL